MPVQMRRLWTARHQRPHTHPLLLQNIVEEANKVVDPGGWMTNGLPFGTTFMQVASLSDAIQ